MRNVTFLKIIPRIFRKGRFYRTYSLKRYLLKLSIFMRIKQFQNSGGVGGSRGKRKLEEERGQLTNSGTGLKDSVIFQVGKNKLKKTRIHWIGIP